MGRLVRARRASLLAGAGLALLLATPVAADGPACTLIGTSTSGGTVDLVRTPVWHLRSSDQVTVTATAPTSQAAVAVNAYVLGYPIRLAEGESFGGETVAEGNASVADYAAFGRSFVIGGTSAGSFGSCEGQFEVIIDDVNPLTAPIGIGSLGTTLIGALVVVWAMRKPGSGWRRFISLLAGGLAVGAATVALQQFTSPDQIAAGVTPSSVATSVPGPTAVVLDPLTVGACAVLALALVIVMPFPAELFNRTLEHHLDQVRGWFGWLPGMKPAPKPAEGSAEPKPTGTSAIGVVAFVLVAAALYSLLDPRIGLDLRSSAIFVGTLLSLLAVTWLASLPHRAAQQAIQNDRGRLRAVIGTLVIGAACVLISRVAGFQPGYLYGLLLGWVFVRELDPRHEGRVLAAGAWWMFGLALVSWLLLGAVRAPGVAGTWPGVVAQNVLGTITVAGIEGIVFAMLPMRFLHGEPVYRWSRARWGLLYFAGAFAFIWIVLNPANGFATAPDAASFRTAVGLFIGFGLASILFWAWFRYGPGGRTPTAHEGDPVR